MLPPHSSEKTQTLDLGLFGIIKQALTKLRLDSQKSAQSNELIRLLSAGHIAATPTATAASFRRSEIVVRWEEVRDCLVAVLVPEEVDHVQEVYLHEQVEDETGDEISTEDELDGRGDRLTKPLHKQK
jgi:hypothetical protein